jgi:hypothetical protein
LASVHQECISGYGIPNFIECQKARLIRGIKSPHCIFPGAATIAAFRKKRSAYKSVKGSVQFLIETIDQELRAGRPVQTPGAASSTSPLVLRTKQKVVHCGSRNDKLLK